MFDQLDEATIKKIKEHYDKGQGSIQDIARVYRTTVETVLHHIGQDELTSVATIGDQIDPSEAGNAALNYQGQTHRANYSTN